MSSEPVVTREWVEDEDLDTTDTNARYIGYAVGALRGFARAAKSAVRYSAYASDVGESFRPVVSPFVVRLSYGISWAYVIGDVAWEGYKAKTHRNEEGKVLAITVAERAIFQTIASIALPMVIIHSQV
eukprot:TRINITY_DN1211_c0_g1_i1.p1 TRINITY_DN1211_c0_g1~~TRINITY_DN1211_c0_g1_i1.p1  ORF type:complete len:128 (+),score=23.56 TRINITY_DN1211_c0_g1_i1:31-414(+)